MKKNKDPQGEKLILDQTIDSLAQRREAPRFVFVLLLVFYLIAAVTIAITAGSQKVIVFGGNPISVYMFAGVLSSVSNMCIVLMVIFCGHPGFIASIIVLLVQCPMMLIGIFVRGNITSIPGIFGNLLTVMVIIGIHASNKKIDNYQSKLLEQAATDILTGLPNGYAETELITELIRRNTPFAACSIDINNFKGINDTLGFNMGNKVLIEVASRWKKIADEGMSGTRDFITRINGDEFSLVIRDHKSEDDVVNTIKKYESAISEKISIDGYDFFISASFGYTLFPTDSDNLDDIVSYSVEAMKEAKRMGSSEHIMRFSFSLLKGRNTLVMDNKVRDALKNDRIFFNLQPQYDMSHRLRGFEALARMKEADESVINPVEFIPAAERTGLIDSIDLTVYRKSATFFASMIKKTGADIVLSINVSVKHLMKNSFIDEIRDLLDTSGIPAGQLEIEITESIMIESAEKAISCLNELRDMGIRIAIDDFGTGYSSLGYLNSIPSDVLKIDKSFIDEMNTTDSSTKYVEAIISLAHVLEFEVIAEGVEETEQLETLKRIGCDYVQGFVWGHPVSKEEAEKIITDECAQ